MNKTELVREVCTGLEEAGVKVTLKAMNEYIDAIFAKISDEMAKGGKVQVTGFGKFEGVTRSAHEARNPQTGEVFMVEEHLSPKFKASSVLKDIVK